MPENCGVKDVRTQVPATGKGHFWVSFTYRAASGGTVDGLWRSFVACSYE